MNLRLIAIVAAAALATAAFAGYRAFEAWLATPLAIEGDALSLDIPRGQALGTTAAELAERGVLEHPHWLQAYARYTGADQRIHAGEYRIRPGTTPKDLLETLQAGEVVQHAITLVEGKTFRDFRAVLESEPKLVGKLKGMPDAEVMAALGEPGKHPEGLFFPDTYFFDKGTSDIELLARARERLRKELDAAWRNRSEDLPIATPYEALVLASIVEKETALASERPRIAGVMTARLRKGMRLQTDPTVIYGMGPDFDGNLRRADLENDTPYNTYTRTGLPPTPIAMVSADAIRAAVQPDERGELYFVATGLPDGSHKFSRTLAEHRRAVREYLVRYRNQDKGR